jgi:hypothetical protein
MHALVRLCLLLLLWLPALAHGQSAEASPPASDAPTLPPLVSGPEEPEAPPKGEIIPGRRASRKAASDLFVPRILLGPLLGGVAASCGAVLGLVLGVMISGCSPAEGDCNDWGFFAPAVVVGSATGSVGVYAMGNFLNGEGKLGPTMLGGALGMGLAILLVSVSEGQAWYAAPFAPAIGAVIGYEISNSYALSQVEPDPFASTGLKVMPMVSRTPEGGLLGGLVGRF